MTRYLKLRPWHLKRVNVPLYAFQTDLTEGRVLRGARRYIERSRVPRAGVEARRPRLDDVAPRPADRGAGDERLPQDGRPVPEADDEAGALANVPRAG